MVKEASVSHQIQLRDLLSSGSGSLTRCNGQRGQRQPSNSTERSAQLRVRFTYILQWSKRPASAIKFNCEICSGTDQVKLHTAMVKEASVSHQIQLRDLLSSGSGSLTYCNGQRGQRQPSNSTERSAQLRVRFTYKLQWSKRPASAIKFN